MPGPYSVERHGDSAVKVEAVSGLSGKKNSMVLPISLDAFIASRDAWFRGALIQNAFPTLNTDEREFLLTGSTPEEWDAAFGEPEHGPCGPGCTC